MSSGQAEEAAAALAVATDSFDPELLPVEHATAANMLGAALRACGRGGEAVSVLIDAAEEFSANGRPLEAGAALFNLGLVRREAGDRSGAVSCLKRARALLDPARVPVSASAAARELGSALFEGGDLGPAVTELKEAVDLAARAGDRAAMGAAANALGLAHLAAGCFDAGVGSLAIAVDANPRSVRPEGYAMAKANLALAYEQMGEASRSRQAARQALSVPGAPRPIQVQARELLTRLGPGPLDLFAVLDDEPRERWPAVLREEMTRWVALGAAARLVETKEWVAGQTARVAQGGDLAEAWVGVLLELPPQDMELVVGATLGALAERSTAERQRFRAQVSSAMVRFHAPQWLRLKDTFNRVSAELGQDDGWG